MNRTIEQPRHELYMRESKIFPVRYSGLLKRAIAFEGIARDYIKNPQTSFNVDGVNTIFNQFDKSTFKNSKRIEFIVQNEEEEKSASINVSEDKKLLEYLAKDVPEEIVQRYKSTLGNRCFQRIILNKE